MAGIDFQGETEESLIVALRQGQKTKLSILYDAYAPVLMGVISRIVRDTEVAEEVLKDTFVTIWSKITYYDASKERFLTWVLCIARDTALEVVKTERYNTIKEYVAEEINRSAQLNKTVTLPDGHLKNQNTCNLSPLEKRALELLYLKGHTCNETATTLKITVPELKALLKEIFTQLKVEKSA